jgi:uncharacterized DUF497 family protein
MNYEWDPKKALSNLKQHGVNFADSVGVFEDENAITIEDTDHSEQRFVIIGLDLNMKILVVVYTYRLQDSIRIISARKAEPHERGIYEKGI